MVLSVEYAPWLNPIEEYFNCLKRYYRGLRVDAIVNKYGHKPQDLVIRAAKTVSLESIRNQIEKA